MFNLSNFPNIHYTKTFDSKENITILTVSEARKPLHCPHCLSENIVKKEALDPRIIYDTFEGEPVKVIINRLRYLCNSCRGTFYSTGLYSKKNLLMILQIMLHKQW